MKSLLVIVFIISCEYKAEKSEIIKMVDRTFELKLESDFEIIKSKISFNHSDEVGEFILKLKREDLHKLLTQIDTTSKSWIISDSLISYNYIMPDTPEFFDKIFKIDLKKNKIEILYYEE